MPKLIAIFYYAERNSVVRWSYSEDLSTGETSDYERFLKASVPSDLLFTASAGRMVAVAVGEAGESALDALLSVGFKADQESYEAVAA